MDAEVFLDTAYAVALSSTRDHHHLAAMQLAEQLERSRTRLVTTQAVLFEIGNALAKQHFGSAAVQLLESLADDPHVEIVWVGPEVHRESYRLFSNRTDKEWGMTDCASFVVMQQRGLTEVLTSDRHFEQAGFKALLLSK